MIDGNHDDSAPSVAGRRSPAVESGANVNIDAIDVIPLTLRVVLGTTTMSVGELARLEPGALVTLDRKLGQPVDLMIDDRLICRGEIGVTEEAAPRFVLRIVEFHVGRENEIGQ